MHQPPKSNPLSRLGRWSMRLAVIGAILTAILINQSSLLAVRQMRDNSAFAAQRGHLCPPDQTNEADDARL